MGHSIGLVVETHLLDRVDHLKYRRRDASASHVEIAEPMSSPYVRDAAMRQLHFSISFLAFCILVAAFDLAALRVYPASEQKWLDLFALPMVNILVFARLMDRSRRRRGQRSLFLLGFQFVGWVAVLSYLIWCMLQPQEVGYALAYASEWVAWITLNNLDYDTMKRLDPDFGLAWRISKASQGIAVSASLTFVMLIVAACGGILVNRSHRKPDDA